MKYFYWSLVAIVLFALIFFIFIPSFAGTLIINPILYVGPLQIHWYGIILAGSILAAFCLARRNSWRFGISPADIDDYSFWLVLVGILGARLYYVIFSFDFFSQDWSEIYKIWHGGLSVYGSILAGLLFSYFYTRNKAYGFLQLVDLIALSLPLGQAIGRLGNFINQEAYGSVTNLPWKMYVALDGQFHHPAFLYEMILDLIVFVVLSRLIGKVKSGIIFFSYLLIYSFGRFFIEAIRVDSFFVNGFRVDQIVALILFVISGVFIFWKQKQSKTV